MYPGGVGVGVGVGGPDSSVSRWGGGGGGGQTVVYPGGVWGCQETPPSHGNLKA